MKRFDLTFRGETLKGHDPQRVRNAMAELFRINDTLILNALFSGDEFVLRSNLDRKLAADYYRKISDVGGRVQLVPRNSDYNAHDSVGCGTEIFVRMRARDPALLRNTLSRRRGEVIAKTEDTGDRAFPNRQRAPRPEAAAVPAGETKYAARAAAVEASAAVAPPRGSNPPSAGEILARLQQLREQTHAQHQARVEAFEGKQDRLKRQSNEALERIRASREEVLLAYQDEFDRLGQLEESSASQLQGLLQHLKQDHGDSVRQLERDLEDLDKAREEALDAFRQAERKLNADIAERRRQGENTQQSLTEKIDQARAEIAALEASIVQLEQQIDDSRERLDIDIDKLERLRKKESEQRDTALGETEARRDRVQRAHRESLDTLDQRCREHRQQFEANHAEIKQSRQRAEDEREDRLTHLWEMEETCRHGAMEQLGKLEGERKREKLAFEQRLQRLETEQQKVRRGEISPPS